MNTKFFYKHFIPNLRSFSKVLGNEVNDLSEGGRFYFNMSRSLGIDPFTSRRGIWSDPFEIEIEPSCIMPEYNPYFNLSFEEITDSRANDVKNLMNSTGRPIFVQWSGGIDSTACLVSLLKNLDNEEKKNMIISMSGESVMENPQLYEKFIKGKFKIVDSNANLLDDYYRNHNAICVVSDAGDCMFGSVLGGGKMYPYMKRIYNTLGSAGSENEFKILQKGISSIDVHYSRYKDIIITYFNEELKKNAESYRAKNSIIHNSFSEVRPTDMQFGELFYEKLELNIKTSRVPTIHSLHDFFWWTLFNQRYVHVVMRSLLNHTTTFNKESLIKDCIFQWYSNDDYQLWSMNNNNNGQKILNSYGTYKIAAKDYIYDFNNDHWYYNHKIKIVSGLNLVQRKWKKHFKLFDPAFGIDTDYNTVSLGNKEVDDLVVNSIHNYKIDW
jgi:hypothetical protein